MWSQNYLAAPWTDGDLFDQIHDNLTNPLAGWTLFEDERAEETYPYVIYRNNQGVGRDVLFYMDLTQATTDVNEVTCRIFLFEHGNYTPGTGTIPAEVIYNTGANFSRNTNLLVNHANTPNLKSMFIWFEQAGHIWPETTLFSIEPYLLDDGVTLMNAADDGTGYPLWGSLRLVWSVANMVGGNNFNRNDSSFSTRFASTNTSRPLRAQSATIRPNLSTVRALFLRAPRTPSSSYQITTRFSGAATSSNFFTEVYPTRRIDAWAGAASFVEAYRPEIRSGALQSDIMKVDARGYLGEPGDLLITQSFGGALGDAFTIGSNNYRIVYSINEGTLNTNLVCELAMRV